MKPATAREIADAITANVEAFWNDEISHEEFATKNESLWMAARANKLEAAQVVKLLPVGRVFGEPSNEEFEPRDYNDADGVETMRDQG